MALPYDAESPEEAADWEADEAFLDGEDGVDYEPDLDFGFEHDSAMTSIGWGTDEDYGYYGDEGF